MDEIPMPVPGGQLVRFYDDGSIVAIHRDRSGAVSRRWLIAPAPPSSAYRIPRVVLELELGQHGASLH